MTIRLVRSFVLWSCLIPPPSILAQDKPAVLSIVALREGLIESGRRWSSAHVVYNIEYDKKILPTLNETTYLRVELACGVKGFYYLDQSHWTNGLSWEEDRARLQIIAQQPVVRFYWTHDRMYEDIEGAGPGSLPSRIKIDPFHLATGWWPTHGGWDTPKWYAKPYMLSDIAIDADYHLEPNLQEREGRWCHVLSNNGHKDTIWIDTERGYVQIARVRRRLESNSIEFESRAWNHEEILPAIWVPRRFDNKFYEVEPLDDRPESAVPSGRSNATIESVHINDRESIAHLAHEPYAGSMWFERNLGRSEQRYPGGKDLLDTQIRRAVRELDREQGHQRDTALPLVLTSLGAFSVVAFVLSETIYRKYQR